MRCRTRPSTRSPLARRPEADTSSIGPVGATAARSVEIGRKSCRECITRERRIIMTIVSWNPFNDMDAHQEMMRSRIDHIYVRPQEDRVRGILLACVAI